MYLVIVFPHWYRRDGTHRRDRTGGAKKRESKFSLKRDRTRWHPSHDYGMHQGPKSVSPFQPCLRRGYDFERKFLSSTTPATTRGPGSTIVEAKRSSTRYTPHPHPRTVLDFEEIFASTIVAYARYTQAKNGLEKKTNYAIPLGVSTSSPI